MQAEGAYPVAIHTKPGRRNLLGIWNGESEGSLSTRAWTALVAACAALLTLVSGITSVVHLAYFSPLLHVAVETAATLISLLAARLILGRYARSTALADLLLGSALVVLAFGNLALSAIPAVLDQEHGSLGTWGALA